MKITEPSAGAILVRLDSGAIPAPEKQHDTVTSGQVIAINPSDANVYAVWVGRDAHWRGYKDDCRLPNKLALIEIKDVLGTTYDDDTAQH